MVRTLIGIVAMVCLMASCRSTRKIQTAITKKDTTIVAVNVPSHSHEDSAALYQNNAQKYQYRI